MNLYLVPEDQSSHKLLTVSLRYGNPERRDISIKYKQIALRTFVPVSGYLQDANNCILVSALMESYNVHKTESNQTTVPTMGKLKVVQVTKLLQQIFLKERKFKVWKWIDRKTQYMATSELKEL